MVESIVREVKDAEARAFELVTQGEADGKEAIKKAKEEAIVSKEKAKKEAQRKADELLTYKKHEYEASEGKISSEIKAMEDEIRSKAKERESIAVEKVIASLY